MSLEILEGLAREGEHGLHDRYFIGYVSGLKRAVLAIRMGESIEELLEQQRKVSRDIHKGKDLYDLGRIEAFVKAIELVEDR